MVQISRRTATGLALGAGAALAGAPPAAAEVNFVKSFDVNDKGGAVTVVTDLQRYGGDGWPDLVSANIAFDHVSSWVGDGQGNAFARTPTRPASQPGGLDAADFDLDGAADVVVTLPGTSQVTVLEGRGDGTFLTPLAAMGTAGISRAVAAGDFTGDGRDDFVAAGSGGLTSYATLTPNSDAPLSFGFAVVDKSSALLTVVMADLDGDGRDDAVAMANNGAVRVYKAQANGTLTVSPIVVEAGQATVEARDQQAGLALGDLDQDGRVDLVTVATGDDARFAVLRNMTDGGTISFAAPAYHSAGTGQTDGVAIGDFDSDGLPDVAVAAADLVNFATTHRVMLNRGGSFEAAAPIPVPYGASPDVADMDADGQLDLVAAREQLQIFLNRSTGTLSPSTGSLGFAATPRGMVSTVQKVVFTNTGHAPLDLGAAGFQGEAAADYDVSTDGCAGLRLIRGDSCEVTVRFAPSAAGARSASLRVSTATIALSGQGTDGPVGPQGSAGPQGPAGPQGRPGRDARVTCTPTRRARIRRGRVTITCRVRLASPARLSARLTRRGRVYARGSGRARSVRLAARRLPAGLYQFTIVYRERGKRVRVTAPVTIR